MYVEKKQKETFHLTSIVIQRLIPTFDQTDDINKKQVEQKLRGMQQKRRYGIIPPQTRSCIRKCCWHACFFLTQVLFGSIGDLNGIVGLSLTHDS